MSDTMIAIGGCHIAGYKVGEENSFINVITKITGHACTHKTAHFQIKNSIGIRERINNNQPDIVLLQIGNYEFHASLKQLFRKKSTLKGKSTENISNSKNKETTTESSILLPLVNEPKASFIFRNFITPVVWNILKYRNRVHLNNIKDIIYENPSVTFVILSPIPCYKTSDNLIRNKAGKWYRKLFAAMPNVTYIDLFRYIAADKRYFEDPAHLNITGHRILGKIVGHYLKPFRKERTAQLAAAV